MSKRNWPASYAHPRYWPAWLAIGCMWLAAWLPWRLKLAIGRGLGLLAWWAVPRRRHIVATNLRLCFPELSDTQRDRLARDTFKANGIGLLETATGWCRDPRHLRHRVTFKGRHHMEQARARGKGVLIVGIHFSTLDLGGALHSLYFTSDAVYRPHNNPLFDRFMTRGRSRIFGETIDRHDLRGVVRRLNEGHSVWYSPDQDFGRSVSVFAPLFGVEAATIRLTAKIARMTGAAVVPLMFHRNPDDSTYTIECQPALEGFPGNDEVSDATRVNAFIEQAISKHPEQYMWLHRRFKTRPKGEPGLY
ncbi:LpxL/LpxP family Kdo(2)-lipid IV(A) lauroyl/palmitoleoyl acyltransferase [Billgrantia diversa]|uniref:LpxL/LpxP family Kdo(2)-lipid IV(A) lauroyl/palmitoleoyl acyltransferase n=1 Tax=Halomonas sp. MCCC 1A13316 TaxID=2733487 RepID=UPI0018A652FE|nr:LpxL/LpxP family Kdo(2)-lipid IV(A) lauroyl/palmitoleoyl acyltransferase [Halomonas sp. MCCC 1A13316]QOR39745.1 LpxL/LpxP family Kdo(2)-lipid IV(A) lauroyl/palmitoleoyl acyltransferase [Halomonas sp. MCCC 1A13316]